MMNAASVGTRSPMMLWRFRILRYRKIASLSRPFPLSSLFLPLSFPVTLLLRRPRGRPPPPNQHRRQKSIDTNNNVELSLDFDDIIARASATTEQFFRSSGSKIHRFFSSGAEAYNDLRTSVRIDRGNRILFCCRQSSLQFVGNFLLWSFVVVLASRVFLWFCSFPHRWFFGGWAVIRRDRSLGGREVVVGRRGRMPEPERRGFRGWVNVNPLSPVGGKETKIGETLMNKQKIKKEILPKWWPDSIVLQVVLFGEEDGQREAGKLVKAIMDKRLCGMDYKDDDIIQLREICRSSDTKVTFETANERDSFFRAAVDLVLNRCARVRPQGTSVQINGEEVRQFICGLADNIGLDNFRAATLVCAAVAARTRSCFLQSWAFEVQGKRAEALEELSNLCQIYQIFPPEENSPEMEMVAGGLSNCLRKEQRTHLLTLFGRACSSGCLRIATEALGLASNASM